jgi:hypothetical protein
MSAMSGASALSMLSLVIAAAMLLGPMHSQIWDPF